MNASMTLRPYTTRNSTPEKPEWKCTGHMGALTIRTGPYGTSLAAVAKCIGMLEAATSHGETGEFVISLEGGYRRVK